MQLLQLERGVHHVADIPFTSFLRRELDPDMMTYYHTQRKVWVAAWWVNKMQGIIKELAVLGPSPASANSAHVRQIRHRMFGDATSRQHKEDLAGVRRAHTRFLGDMQRHWNSHKDFIRYNHPNPNVRNHPNFAKSDLPSQA